MSGRDQIRMTAVEIADYLEAQKVIQVATIGPNGRPHLAPLWYVRRGTSPDGTPVLATWTYAKSQKAMNLRRLPQATVLVESGQTYSGLAGVSMECDVEILEDYEGTLAIGLGLAERYDKGYDKERAAVVADFEKQARKRIGLVLTATRTVTWDFSKLG